jgi:hypothetical protein
MCVPKREDEKEKEEEQEDESNTMIFQTCALVEMLQLSHLVAGSRPYSDV